LFHPAAAQCFVRPLPTTKAHLCRSPSSSTIHAINALFCLPAMPLLALSLAIIHCTAQSATPFLVVAVLIATPLTTLCCHAFFTTLAFCSFVITLLFVLIGAVMLLQYSLSPVTLLSVLWVRSITIYPALPCKLHGNLALILHCFSTIHPQQLSTFKL